MDTFVLITGATSGIGEATAHKFAGAGRNIIITGRRQERLTALKNTLQIQHGVVVVDLCFDVQDREAVFAAIDGLPHQAQNIQVLVNNAGLALGKQLFDEAELTDWETMMQTNVNGLMYVTKAVLPLLKKTGGGHIINISSTAGKEVYKSGNAYCASKFAVGALSKAMRIDLLQHAIKVTCVYPGAVDTEFSLVRFKGETVKAEATYLGYSPLQAADVAGQIFYVTTLPPHVCINELVITCTAQASSYYLYKNGKNT